MTPHASPPPPHVPSPASGLPAPSAASILFAVMSYNRGESLELAVQSIERNAPGASLTVIDDASTCPATLGVLHGIAGRHRVMVSRAGSDAVYLRGLHANMNAALDLAIREGFSYIFFIQDDQQVVRSLDSRFYRELSHAFMADTAIVQVSSMFFKGFHTKAHYDRVQTVSECGLFYSGIGENMFGMGDVGILSLERVKAAGFRFADTEGDSSRLAKTLRLRLVTMKNPVLMYTPWPRTVRDHPDTVKRLNLGVHPFEYMSEAEVAAFCDRSPSEYPVAERYLRTTEPLRQPWWYTVINDFTVNEYLSFCRLKQEAGEL